MLKCILCSCKLGMHLFIIGRGIFCVFAGMGDDSSTYVELHVLTSLAWEGFWSTHVVLHIESSLDERGLVNSCCDTFSVFAGLVCVWSTRV